MRSNIFFIKLLFIFTICITIASCGNKDNVEALLEKEIATENARCPIRFNENIIMDSCRLLPQRIIQYHYRLAFSGLDSAVFINQYKPQMIEALKKQPTAKLYQKEGVGYQYIYNDMNGNYLFRLNILSNDYK